MSHSKTNNALAALVFAMSFLTYMSTLAPTTSFWDCGEFIACSYILGVPHPPGAPLYILVGRLFSMMPSFIAEDVGLRVNIMSPIISAFTAMLTYLIIVRLILVWREKPQTWMDKLIVYGSGVIGALAFAFSDSQWFNSVEAEVYAGSMFFTAIVVWLILKWMDHSESAQSDRYILIIFYILGLAIGVHLLNLLALPTIAMIIFAKRHQARKGAAFNEFWLMVVMAGLGVVTLGAINLAVVRGIPALMDQVGLEAVVVAVLALFGLAIWAVRNKRRYLALAFMCSVLVVVGYSTYSVIFIRSTLNPEIDENNPDTPARLVSYLNREQYGDWSIAERTAPLWEYQIKKMYLRYFGWQFIGKGTTLDEQGRIIETITLRGLFGLPFILGLLGMYYHFRKDWRHALPILTLFVMTGFAIIIYLNQIDPQPRERDYAYTGSFFAFALWIGIGVAAILETLQENLKPAKAPASKSSTVVTSSGRVVEASASGAGLALAAAITLLLLVAVPINMFAFNYHSHDRGGNYVAYDYSYNILQSCEPNAIVFTNGDNDTFPLWFLQYVHNIRKDVRVVNLSLLNTNWYIKQLRDDEPKLALNMSEGEIEQIQPRLWEKKNVTLAVPKPVYESAYLEAVKLDPSLPREENPTLRFEVKPTLNTPYGTALRVQDIMILKILQDNQFRRPVYFAVTVSPENKIGLDPYLRMDGLAFRIMPIRNERRLLDPNLMWTNISEKFLYRNLNNPKIYYDDNIQSLLQNYRSAFLHLAQFHLSRRENAEALKVLDRMGEVMPEKVIPTNELRVSEAIGYMYMQAGRPEELDRRYHEFVQREYANLSDQDKLGFADLFDYRGKPALAESLVQELIKKNPNYSEGYYWLGRFYSKRRDTQKGIDLMNRWLTKNPGDQQANALLQQLRALAPKDSVPNSAGTSVRSDSAAQ